VAPPLVLLSLVQHLVQQLVVWVGGLVVATTLLAWRATCLLGRILQLAETSQLMEAVEGSAWLGLLVVMVVLPELLSQGQMGRPGLLLSSFVWAANAHASSCFAATLRLPLPVNASALLAGVAVALMSWQPALLREEASCGAHPASPSVQD